MKNKRVAIYLRVSTSDQSTEMQRAEILEYIKRRGFDDYTIYEDDGLTGTNGNRPQLKQLMKDVKARKVDIVVTWKLDRLFRSLKGLVLTLQEFTELGVEFISLKEQIDLTTSTGRLMAGLIGCFAEFEASLIRERVVAGLENAKAKGKKLGRPSKINAYEAARLRAQGLSLSQIGKQLGVSKSTVSKTLSQKAAQDQNKKELSA